MKLTPQEIQNKLAHLEEVLAKTPGLVIGFSGGVDSSLLVTVAHKVLGDKMLAVTIDSIFSPRSEIKAAQEIVALESLPHAFVQAEPLSNELVASNPPDRCYHCKKMLFTLLLKKAQAKGFKYVADGSNVDDDADYRPGMRAIKELQVISPLKDAELTKEDIRALSHFLKLPTWKKESAACLASRLPYGETITAEKLLRVEKAEDFLAKLALTHLRVRSHGTIARIEVGQEDFAKFAEAKTRQAVSTHLKSLGFSYVALDLEGYRTGSLNELLPKK